MKKSIFQVQVCRWPCSLQVGFHGLILGNSPMLILDSEKKICCDLAVDELCNFPLQKTNQKLVHLYNTA